MTTNTASQFDLPNDLPAVAARSIEEGTRRDDERRTESDFEFLIVCFVLTAVIFALIHAVVYFTGSTGSSNAAAGISAESVMSPKGNRAATPILP